MKIIDNDLLSMQEARILIENAHEAQQKLSTFPQEKLDEIVARMIEEIQKHLKELSELSAEETEYGKVEDKYIKNKFVCKYLNDRLKSMKCVGVIDEDDIGKTLSIGVPMGVIVAFCAPTNPVSTTIYKSLIAIKSGNAIVFSPHKRSQNVVKRALEILIRAAEGVGLPEGALAYLHTISKSGSIELMNHKNTALIMNTGVSEMLKDSYKSGKPVIYGGNGNGPAFIERTADVVKAVDDIVCSKSFDNGVVSAAEQAVVVDSSIAKEVEIEFLNKGAYFMSEDEAEKLAKVLTNKDGSLDLDMIGKTPQFLSKRAGFSVKDNTKILISKQKYVSKDNFYSKEKLSPVLAFYIEDDWMHACEKCIELLLTEKYGHTLIIHSKDEDVIRQFAIKKPVGRILVNTPGTFGSMGGTTNLFPSMTLGSGSAGKGMTSDNVSPMNLIYIRKVGYEIRGVADMFGKEAFTSEIADKSAEKDNYKLLEDILKKILEK
ncbi:MAG: aldehyde dehydrogenase family protein [Tissierellales bacterium]|jgi:acyl-CoA reductase-like NAD-dependent aldehyde dehydrogenase|nr:aldehyde dehydrogenase family protein [Tissierellales bacterium]